jgi:4-amino-4-deoxy-L-arabinose transferase-like glycosyltransferase
MARKKTPQSENRKYRASVSLSFLLGLLAQLSFALDISLAAGVILYFFAACLFVQSLRLNETSLGQRHDSGPPAPRADKFAEIFCKYDWLPVLVLTSIAAFFRLYRLDSQPASLWLDEGFTGVNALQIIEGKPATIWGVTPLDPWRPDWVKTTNLYLYYAVGMFKIFGSGYFGLKMLSVAPAIASVAVAYFLFKTLTDRRTAFLAAFLIAVSQWHVTVSRWGWDALLMSFLQLTSYLFLTKGLKTGRKLHLVAGGISLGLSLYTYVAAWVAVAIAALFLLARALRDRLEPTRRIHELLLFFAGCLIVVAPLAVHYVEYPRDLTVRASEVSIANAVEEANNYLPLWESFKNHALMFNYQGDRNPRHGFPRAPALDFVTAIFFILGLASQLRSWREPQSLFVLLWFGLGLHAGLLAEPSASPHAYRTFMINPVACLFAASGIQIFFTAVVSSLMALRFRRIGSVIFYVTLLGSISSINYRTYFVARPQSREVWEEEGRDGGLPARIQGYRNESALVMIDPLLLWKIVVVNSWFLNYEPGRMLDASFLPANLLMAETRLAQTDGERPLVFVFSPGFLTLIRTWLPDANSELMRSPFNEPLYGIVRVTTDQFRSRLASTDKTSLAAAVQKIALHYRREAAADAEIGPRRKFLLDESQIGMELARRLDPGLP